MEKRMNGDVRRSIERAGLRYWEVAARCGVTGWTFSVWLRQELSPARKQQIEQAIASLAAERAQTATA